jgi:hypothetical protein
LPLSADPECPVRVSYYRIAIPSNKWKDVNAPGYRGQYHFEIFGENAYFFCSTYAEIAGLTIDYAIPAGLGIKPSDKIEELLEGKGSKFLVDGLTAAAHRILQECICCMICVLYLLKGDVKAMRIALYNFSSRITTNPRRPSGDKRCRSPFIIDKRNGTVYLSQDFAFGNILDDCPYSTKYRLYTGVQLGPG